jgi:hypothetical protein
MEDLGILLARHSGVGQVQFCSCNLIHLSLGAITINLDPETFAQTATMMRNALDEFSRLVAAGVLRQGSSDETRKPVEHIH